MIVIICEGRLSTLKQAVDCSVEVLVLFFLQVFNTLA